MCLLMCLAVILPSVVLADFSDQPVFDGNGRKTDQVVIANAGFDDAFFPINLNNNWGLMNQHGQIVVYPRYQWTDYSFEGMTRFVMDGRTGYLRGEVQDDNNPNDFAIPATYEYADRFSNGVAVVMQENRWGMIERTGRVLVPLEYDGVLRMQDGFAGVERDGLCGFVNRAGDLRIPLQFQKIRSFHSGYAAVQLQNGNWGYIDKRGTVVWQDTTGRVRMLGDFHQQYARVQVRTDNGDLRWGYLTKAFRWRFDPVYEDARDFHNGFAAVKSEGLWGFINNAGRWAVDPQFEAVDSFDDAERSNDFEDDPPEQGVRPGARDLTTAGLYALVRHDGQWGYINRTASAGLIPQFGAADPFFRGLARVSRDDSFAYIGETGQVRFDPRVALELGFVDLRSGERARVANYDPQWQNNFGGGDDRPPNNQVVPPPVSRGAYEVPYPPEHLYEEALPVQEP